MPAPQPHQDELLTIQELADALKRSRRYVQQMRRLGFRMPGDRGTLGAALAWLAEHPTPTSSRHRHEAEQFALPLPG